MVRHPTELLRALTRHYPLLSAMCRENRRFASDAELEAYCAGFIAPGSSAVAVAGRLREVGAVTQATGDWAPPPYLRAFLAEIEQRHALASPGVVRGWIEKLSALAAALEQQTGTPAAKARGTDAGLIELLDEITDTLASIVGAVSSNCDRIGAEVSRYRAEEDAKQMRARLGRLIKLHGDYLEPVLGLIDIGGDFHQVCERIAACCATVGVDAHLSVDSSAGQVALTTARDVVWVRRVTLRRALEANRELGPLCEAALRETTIARGVNRALAAVAAGRWDLLDLANSLQVVIDQDGPLVADRAAASFAAVVRQHRPEPPPLLEETAPALMEVPWSAATLLEDLWQVAEVPDTLEWVCDRVGLRTADVPAGLLHDLLESVPEGFAASEKARAYAFESVEVEACIWAWRAPNRE